MNSNLLSYSYFNSRIVFSIRGLPGSPSAGTPRCIGFDDLTPLLFLQNPLKIPMNPPRFPQDFPNIPIFPMEFPMESQWIHQQSNIFQWNSWMVGISHGIPEKCTTPPWRLGRGAAAQDLQRHTEVSNCSGPRDRLVFLGWNGETAFLRYPRYPLVI